MYTLQHEDVSAGKLYHVYIGLRWNRFQLSRSPRITFDISRISGSTRVVASYLDERFQPGDHENRVCTPFQSGDNDNRVCTPSKSGGNGNRTDCAPLPNQEIMITECAPLPNQEIMITECASLPNQEIMMTECAPLPNQEVMKTEQTVHPVGANSYWWRAYLTTLFQLDKRADGKWMSNRWNLEGIFRGLFQAITQL